METEVDMMGVNILPFAKIPDYFSQDTIPEKFQKAPGPNRPFLRTPEERIETLKLFLHTVVFAFFIAVTPAQQAAAENTQNSTRTDLKRKLSKPPENFQAVGEIYEGFLEHRRSVRIPLPINEAGCYRVIVATDKSAEDISVAVYQSNVEKARDRLSGKHPVVDWCAAKGGNVEAEVQMFSGRGAFALATFMRNSYKPSAAGIKVGGEDKDFIANRIRQLKPQFAKTGNPESGVLRGNLEQGDNQSFLVNLDKRCHTIIVGQEPSLIKLDIRLTDAKKDLPVRVQTTSSFTILETVPCLQTSGEYRIIVRATQGAGRFGFQIFSQ